MAFPKYQTKEVLNKVLNSAETALQVDVVSGSEYAEDSVHSSTDVGTFVLGVRQDSIAALGADGDYVPFQVNASGALYVEISSGGSADAAHVDDAGFTLGTHSGMMMMGFAGTQSVDANDAGAIAMETDGSVHIHDGGNTITVDGTVTANLSAIDNAVLDAMVVDLAALETLQTSTNTKLDTLETTLTAIETDQAAIETLLTAANVDHAANEVLLGTIDADTGAIKTAVEIIDNAISGSQMQVDIVADGAGLATDANLALMLYGTALAVTAVHGGSDHTLGATYEAFYIGVGGDVSLDCVTSGTNIVFKNLASGQMLPVRATVVNATNTTATNIVALKA